MAGRLFSTRCPIWLGQRNLPDAMDVANLSFGRYAARLKVGGPDLAQQVSDIGDIFVTEPKSRPQFFEHKAVKLQGFEIKPFTVSK